MCKCDSCIWKQVKRVQRCSTCKRNKYLKDNFKPLEGYNNDSDQKRKE